MSHSVRVSVSTDDLGPFVNQIAFDMTTLLADEPAELGGNGQGPNPHELLLAALGACTSMTLRMYASHKNLPLDRIRVDLTHQKVDGRDLIQRRIHIEGDLTAEQQQRMLEIAEKCPIHKVITGGQAEIKSELF
jgi:putative redox protein